MSLLRQTLVACAVGLTVVTAMSTTVQAQASPTRIIAINPFLPLVASFQAEFEKKLQDNLSVAVSASHIALRGGDSDRFTNADVKLRLYPAERALEGFGIAAGVGVGQQSAVTYVDCLAANEPCRDTRATRTGPAFSVEMQYQWLLGKNQHTAVSAGGGAKRYFISNTASGSFNEFMPTLRLTVGYAFR
jgi:hypothetical protein